MAYDKPESFKDQNQLISSARTWAALTPSDTENFPFVPKGITISSVVGGTFIAVGEDDVAAQYYGNPGQFMPLRPKRINATGLTAGMTFTGLRT